MPSNCLQNRTCDWEGPAGGSREIGGLIPSYKCELCALGGVIDEMVVLGRVVEEEVQVLTFIGNGVEQFLRTGIRSLRKTNGKRTTD